MINYKDFNYNLIFEKFKNKTILVIGDVMIDTYLIGKVERISPEAPVPICDIYDKEYKLGGSSNVAINLQKLGAYPIICSVIGDDYIGELFMKLIIQNELDESGIIIAKNRKTTNKTRIIGNNSQMLRIDEETKDSLEIPDYLSLSKIIEKLIKNKKIDGIIFEDYDKGIINRVLIDKVLHISKGQIPIYVDPKYKNFNLYHNVEIFKPNLTEFKNGLKIDFGDDLISSLKKNCKKLHEERNIKKIMITMADKGIFISVKDGEQSHFPTSPRNVVDVSGAGDVVISISTLMDVVGCDLGQTAFISNIAGGIVCEQIGVVPIDMEKLLKEIYI